MDVLKLYHSWEKDYPEINELFVQKSDNKLIIKDAILLFMKCKNENVTILFAKNDKKYSIECKGVQKLPAADTFQTGNYTISILGNDSGTYSEKFIQLQLKAKEKDFIPVDFISATYSKLIIV